MRNMASKNQPDWNYIFSKRLMLGGFVLILAGILWRLNVDWPTILIIIGAILLVKGFLIKAYGKII